LKSPIIALFAFLSNDHHDTMKRVKTVDPHDPQGTQKRGQCRLYLGNCIKRQETIDLALKHSEGVF
jgi:hypothetical protein